MRTHYGIIMTRSLWGPRSLRNPNLTCLQPLSNDYTELKTPGGLLFVDLVVLRLRVPVSDRRTNRPFENFPFGEE